LGYILGDFSQKHLVTLCEAEKDCKNHFPFSTNLNLCEILINVIFSTAELLEIHVLPTLTLRAGNKTGSCAHEKKMPAARGRF
jgi:hypothetical protein